jgi:hypothetical protein
MDHDIGVVSVDGEVLSKGRGSKKDGAKGKAEKSNDK